MTAEIAVLNKSAVALAADSKVTIGGGTGGKTFDTVNKVFTLSKVHPVGIMIFGNAEFMRYPWEVIVKLYRSEKGVQSEATIEDWGEDFVSFVRRFGDIRPEDRSQNVEQIIASWFSQMRFQAVRKAEEDGIRVPSGEFTELLLQIVKGNVRKADKLRVVYNSTYMKRFTKEHGESIDQVVSTYFSGFENAELTSESRGFADLAISRQIFSPVSSGVVIAGFGASQHFPAIIHFSCDGYTGQNVKICRDLEVKISRDLSSMIAPFAQKEMVQRFMNGVDPEFHTFIRTNFLNLMVENCLTVLDKYGRNGFKGEKHRDAIVKSVIASWKSGINLTREYQSENFSDPIIEMVSLLPKDELPNLAESLVALTSLKRHVSHDVETVGGPIDVALISKATDSSGSNENITSIRNLTGTSSLTT